MVLTMSRMFLSLVDDSDDDGGKDDALENDGDNCGGSDGNGKDAKVHDDEIRR